MRVIIAGSRDITSYAAVQFAVKDSGFNITEVVSGGARGVDRLGERYAEDNNIPIQLFLPDWNRDGIGAGFIRNTQMAAYADALIAIWDGVSKGTKHMIKTMERENKKVFVYTRYQYF